MPTVPTSGAPIQQAPLPGARFDVQASPRAFGAGAAAGAQDLADSSVGIMLRERENQRKVRLQDWSNRLAEHENKLLYDPQTGAFQKRGKDAFGIVDPTLGDLDAFAGDLQKEAVDGEEQQALHDLTADRRNGVQRALMQHVAGEVRNFDDQSFGSGLATSKSAALANYADPHRVDEEAYRQLTSIKDYADRHGLPQEWVQDQQSKAQSETYSGAIGRMIDRGDDLAAKDAMDRWGGALTGEDGARIDAALKETSSRSESRRQADDIVGNAPDLQTALGALEQRGIKDVNIYDRTKARIVDHFQLERQAKEQAQSDLFDAATLSVDQASSPGDPESVPSSTWAALEPKFKRELMAYQAAKAKGIPIATNWDTYYQLRSLASTDATRSDFLQTDLRGFRSQLSDADFKELTGVQVELRQNTEKGRTALVEWGVVDRVANETLIRKGINTSTSMDNNPQLQDANAFRQALGSAVNAAAQSKGSRPDYDEVRKIADRLVLDTAVTTPGRLWGTNTDTVPTFKAPGADKIVFSVEQIPAAERQRVVDGLRRGIANGRGTPPPAAADLSRYGQNVPDGTVAPDDAGILITPEMIVDAYNRVQLGAKPNGR